MSQSLVQDPDLSTSTHFATLPTRESRVVATPPRRMGVEAFGHTDTGLVREGNEDSFAVLHDLGLFMVADGMGGAAAGEIASRMTIDCVREAFENTDVTWPASAGPRSAGRPDTSLMVAAVQRANSHVLSISRRHPDKHGMGTTFAGLLALEDRVVIAHVGDSRVYRLRGRRLDLLTEDHSLLNDFIRAGIWDPAEADSFPHRNTLTRAVGTHDELVVETRIDVPQPGDRYLICSDGLHGLIDDQQLAAVLLKHEDLMLAVSRLIDLANDHGGHDNITAILLRFAGKDPE